MTKKILSLVLILLLCGSLAVCAFAAADTSMLLVDEADLLTDTQEQALLTELQTLSQAYGAQVSVITLSTLDGYNIDDYIGAFYDSGNYGYGEDKAGVMLMIVMDTRDYRILSNGFAAEAITLDDIDSISDWIVPDLSGGDYAAAFQSFAQECDYYLNGYINGFPFDPAGTLMMVFPIGLVVALITVLIMKGQLKSVHRQDRASDYVKAGSMQITQSGDYFMYRNVTRTVRQQNTSSSGSRSSGSSRNIGGGKF